MNRNYKFSGEWSNIKNIFREIVYIFGITYILFWFGYFIYWLFIEN